MLHGTNRKSDSDVYFKIVGRLLHSGAWENLQRLIGKLHPSDLAEVLRGMTVRDRDLLLSKMVLFDKLGPTLLEMHDDLRVEILHLLDDQVIARLITKLRSDDASELMQTLDDDRVERIIDEIPDQYVRRRIRQILSYTEETAGSMMQTEFLALEESELVSDAVALIRHRYRNKPIFYLYTLDSDSRLSGVVSFRQLLLSDGDQSLSLISKKDVAKVFVSEDRAAVARMVYRYDLLAVPVVDSKNRLVGIITVDDVMDVMEDEVSEDIYKLAGSDVEELMYGNKIFKISRVRLPWLMVSVATGLITAMIIGFFEHTLETVIALTSFIPVIAGMAGNIGTQSSAITVRGLAVGRLSPVNLFSIVWREMRVGIILGLTCGCLVGILGSVWFGKPALGLVVGFSMITGISFAATTGAFLPMVFSRLNVDPAVASGPLVTTLNDCISTIIYLSAASCALEYLV